MTLVLQHDNYVTLSELYEPKFICLQWIITCFQTIIRAVIMIYGYGLHRKWYLLVIYLFIYRTSLSDWTVFPGQCYSFTYVPVDQLASDCASVLTGWARPTQREGKILFWVERTSERSTASSAASGTPTETVGFCWNHTICLLCKRI